VEIAEAAQQGGDGDLPLEPGERRAEAEMDAGGKGQVLVRGTRDIEAVASDIERQLEAAV